MEYTGHVRKFAELFAPAGDIKVARAPGLLTFLGELTECNGLPVLSMPIADDAKVAFAPRKDGLVRFSTFGPSGTEVTFNNAPKIAPSPAGAPEAPCKVAVQALNAHFSPAAFPGMDILCDVSVLDNSGLNLHAPVTVACALAYLRVLGRTLGKDISRLELAGLMAKDLPHSGGAEYATVLSGQQGEVCKVDVFPLRVESVPLFERYAMVTCNPMATASEKEAAALQSKSEPLLCRLISEIVTKIAQEEFGDEIVLDRLGDLWHGHLCLTDKEVKDLCDRAFPQERTTLDEAARVLGVSPKELREHWLVGLAEPEGGFPLQARVRHQLGEYRCVELGRDALLAHDPVEFGRLLNVSHESCLRNCFLDCPQLDFLVAVARKAGAIGARLSGEGPGGCTVNLVPVERLDAFVQTMEEDYFATRRERQGINPPDSRILVSQSGSAADYVNL